MAVGVKIIKYRENINEYFYKLYSLDWERVVLYMKIEPLKNTITYSRCSDFSHVDSKLDLSNENTIIKSIPNIDFIIINKSVTQAVKAIRENLFPESISYYS